MNPPLTAPSRYRRWADIAVVLGLVLVMTVVLRAFVVQTYIIPSLSMSPTLQVGDRIVVDKLSYHLHDVHRGDVVVFARPPGEAICGGPVPPDLVKRVIGLPGETISSVGNTVVINGKPLREPWFASVALGSPIHRQVIPANQYFMMGDNRGNSCDSRYWGTVPRSSIVGRAVAVTWPIGRIKGL